MLLNPQEFFSPEQCYDLDICHQRMKYDLEKAKLAKTPEERDEAQRDLASAQHQMSSFYTAYLMEAHQRGRDALPLDAVLTLIKD